MRGTFVEVLIYYFVSPLLDLARGVGVHEVRPRNGITFSYGRVLLIGDTRRGLCGAVPSRVSAEIIQAMLGALAGGGRLREYVEVSELVDFHPSAVL